MAQNNDYDIIIVGGGLSGLSLSCLLGRHGLNIACIDQADPKVKPKDLRTTVISYGSRQILERTNAWDNVKTAAPIHDIQILDGSSPVLLEFLSRDADDKAFGWNVDNHDLKCALLKCMGEYKNVRHIAPANVEGFAVAEGRASVHLDGGQTLTAKLIVGADGRGSAVRDFMGVHTRGWSYHQRAVICNITHTRPHDHIAIEHFYPAGPFAVLPLTDDEKGTHRSSIVFTEHGPDSDSLLRLTDEEFEAALATRIPARYGEIKLLSPRKAFPLNLIHAAEYIAPRMVLVADAAHGIHPIAGQGLNLGFRDLGVLDELIQRAVQNGTDFASPDLLEEYQSRRRPDNMAMIAVTDGINRLFSNNVFPVRVLRRTGLKLVSRLRPAKKFFMKQAMGDR